MAPSNRRCPAWRAERPCAPGCGSTTNILSSKLSAATCFCRGCHGKETNGLHAAGAPRFRMQERASRRGTPAELGDACPRPTCLPFCYASLTSQPADVPRSAPHAALKLYLNAPRALCRLGVRPSAGRPCLPRRPARPAQRRRAEPTTQASAAAAPPPPSDSGEVKKTEDVVKNSAPSPVSGL